jgi:hypothetical protein
LPATHCSPTLNFLIKNSGFYFWIWFC